MAYVAITGQLKSDVIQGIRRKCATEAATLPNTETLVETNVKTPEFQDWVNARLWQGFPEFDEHEREKLNKYAFANSVELVVKHKLSDASTLSCSRYARLDRIPPVLKSLNRFVIEDAAESLPWYPQVCEALQLSFECANRWKAVEKQVTDFLSNCKSLNEAVKLWPDVRRYIPDSYLRRLDTKSEAQSKADDKRRAALEALKAIDTENIAVSETLLRMAQGAAGNAA
jgi:hypothetical protein